MTASDALILVGPWLTGGLAGALLTFAAKAVGERRRQKRVTISEQTTVFSLPHLAAVSLPSGSHQLKVAYNGTTYDNLFSYSAVAKNVGSSAVPSFSLIFLVAPSATVVATFSRVQPLVRSLDISTNVTVEASEHICAVPRLEPGDVASINLLVDSPQTHVACLPRGADDVQFLESTTKEGLIAEWFLLALLLFQAAYAGHVWVVHPSWWSLPWEIMDSVIYVIVPLASLAGAAIFVRRIWRRHRPKIYRPRLRMMA